MRTVTLLGDRVRGSLTAVFTFTPRAEPRARPRAESALPFDTDLPDRSRRLGRD
jgi:hypothetical protein